MEKSILYTIKDQIKNIKINRPHLVLLGAGASRAAFPNGDKNGKKIPLMNDLVDILNIKEDFNKYNIDIASENFEEIFSDLYTLDNKHPLIKIVEDKIFDYFYRLELPDTPTIYDYLVLSLRDKDVIATFNWDPFLWLAACRNCNITKIPHLIFLHGNVAIGYCDKCRKKGQNNYPCQKCGKTYSPSKLLYPIKEKAYNSGPHIQSEWFTMKEVLGCAYLFTIFGYGAPKSDVEAIKIIKESWGDANERKFEQIEFIHKPGEDKDNVTAPWKDLMYPHFHYQTTDDFFKSLITTYPRRTCDVFWTQSMECLFAEENPIPQDVSLQDLQNWFKELIKYE
jgi:hypothetical protein